MHEADHLKHERMRWAIDEAFRALMRGELHVHKYYEPAVQQRHHEATSVQGHVLQAYEHLKMALMALGEDQIS